MLHVIASAGPDVQICPLQVSASDTLGGRGGKAPASVSACFELGTAQLGKASTARGFLHPCQAGTAAHPCLLQVSASDPQGKKGGIKPSPLSWPPELGSSQYGDGLCHEVGRRFLSGLLSSPLLGAILPGPLACPARAWHQQQPTRYAGQSRGLVLDSRA